MSKPVTERPHVSAKHRRVLNGMWKAEAGMRASERVAIRTALAEVDDLRALLLETRKAHGCDNLCFGTDHTCRPVSEDAGRSPPSSEGGGR